MIVVVVVVANLRTHIFSSWQQKQSTEVKWTVWTEKKSEEKTTDTLKSNREG